MRRLIATLLLLLLPTQFAFAAAAAYCGFDKPEAPSHFGHHQHADASPQIDPEDDRSGFDESDCGICHLGCAKMQPSVSAVAALEVVRLDPRSSDAPQPEHLQEPFDRPPRSALA